MGTYSGKYNIREIGKYKEIFERENCTFSAPQYMHFQARKAGLTASFYTSGKFVLQGDLTEEVLGKHFGVETSPCKAADILPYPHIGVDESGKGDFLGPLVVAGAYLTQNSAQVLQELGVCDSKKLNDKKILALERQIKEVAIWDVISISPKKYNELYQSFKNLNKLLAWGHATIIENILKKQACEFALCDKFGDEKFILNALKEKGKQIELVQRTKAEEDTAVAAASILARAEFVKRISHLAREYEVILPKGAGAQVLNAAKAFAGKFGKEELKNIAKLHFKTYEQI